MPRLMNISWSVCLGLLIIMSSVAVGAQPEFQDADARPILVGRLSHVEGQVLRYDPDEDDWIAVVKNSPFGLNDSLYSEKGARTEIIIPNNTWIRIGDDTQIRVIELKDDLTDLELMSGTARFYNKGSYPVIKARTPFGDVTAPAKTVFELKLSEDSLEVKPLKGAVYFTHWKNGQRHEVIAGSSSLIAGDQMVTVGMGYADPIWEAWNRDRDALWAVRMKSDGKSARYLPSNLYDHAYVLDENGVWERVYYAGGYYNFWRPIYVGPAWVPFAAGNWTIWCGDHTWIPHEPFGYVTHHYGNWIFSGGRWYWAPPVTRFNAHLGAALLHISFAWYPARVAWIYSGAHIGWIPLAPHERYYCRNRWGPKVVVVKNIHVANSNVHVTRYRNYKHAVVINQKDFYAVKHYSNHRAIAKSRALVLKNYHVTPVPDQKGIKRYSRTVPRNDPVRSDRNRKISREGTQRSSAGPMRAVNLKTHRPTSFSRDDQALNLRHTETKKQLTLSKTGLRPAGAPAVNKANPSKDRPRQKRKGPEDVKMQAKVRSPKESRQNVQQLLSKPVLGRYRQERRSAEIINRSSPKKMPAGTRVSSVLKGHITKKKPERDKDRLSPQRENAGLQESTLRVNNTRQSRTERRR